MSDDFGLRGPKLPWACPNDRQLALRAKLQTGWSIKTNTFNQYPKPPPLTEREQQIIVSVVKKAEELDLYEQQRVGKLVDRLESLKKLANGNGTTECVLCGDTFGLSVFGRSNYKCHDCGKAVCRKCVVEITVTRSGSSKETLIRLCKVCSENRELIKKSGAWFFKGVPKYILPEKKNHYTNSYEKYAASPRSYQEQKYVSRYVNAEEGPSTSSNSNNSNNATGSSSSSGAVATSSTSTITSAATTGTTSSCTSTTSSSSKPGGFFWSRNLQSRSGSSSHPTASDQDQESSSGDEGGSLLLRHSAGASASAAAVASSSSSLSGPRHHYIYQQHNQHTSLNLAGGTSSGSPSGAAATLPSTSTNNDSGSNQNGSSSVGSLLGRGSWSKLSFSRGHSPPVPRPRQQSRTTSPSPLHSSSTDTSPVPAIVTTTGDVEQCQLLSGQEASTGSGLLGGGLTESGHGYPSSLDLSSSSSRKKSVERFDFSKEALQPEQQQQQGACALSADSAGANNGDNNPKSSASSSNDCLYQQGLVGAAGVTHNSTPSMSAASSTTSAAASSSGGGNAQVLQGSAAAAASPLGTIQVALLYDDTHQALHCSVHHAKDLVPMDINGLSDPYCILKLIPSRFEGTHHRTKTVHKSVNPIYNETLTFYGVTPHDLTWQTLQILVMDEDRWGKDCLGATQIPLHRIRAQHTRLFSQSLERGRLSEEREWGRGRLLLSLTYLTEKSLLLVGVIQAQDLPALDHNGTSDPFVKVRLLHDTNLGALSTSCFSSSSINRKFRTSVKWRTLNPEFREEFSLKVSIVDLPRLALIISVWDKDLGKNDDYIGGIVLSNGSKGERLKHWLDMMKLPNTKHFKWHTLSPAALPNH